MLIEQLRVINLRKVRTENLNLRLVYRVWS